MVELELAMELALELATAPELESVVPWCSGLVLATRLPGKCHHGMGHHLVGRTDRASKRLQSGSCQQ